MKRVLLAAIGAAVILGSAGWGVVRQQHARQCEWFMGSDGWVVHLRADCFNINHVTGVDIRSPQGEPVYRWRE